MDWQTVTVIVGVLGTIVAAILKFAPERRGRTVEMKPQQHKTLEEKLDKLQDDVSEIEGAVKVLENTSQRAEKDIVGLRGQIEGMRTEISSLKDMIVKHILNGGK